MLRLDPILDVITRRRARYARVFDTADGRWVLHDIFAFVGMNRQISVPDDPHSTFFNDGQRDVALRLARLLGMSAVQILGAADAGMKQAPSADAAHAFLFERRAAYRRAFDGKEGLWVLHDMLRACRVGLSVAGSGDALSAYFNDGQRRVALRIVSLINMTDEEILRLAGKDKETPDDEA